MIRRLFVCPDLMRVPKGKRIMKNRRQFLIDNVSAWFLAPELAKRIEWVANHGEKPYLPKLDKPGQGDPLGRLDLVQGPHPGSNATYAFAECESTLSCLQHRLLELKQDVEIIVTQ